MGYMPKKLLSKAKLAGGAAVLIQQVLSNEEVRKALSNAPRDVIRWASRKRADYKAGGSASRFDPTTRFGQKGLERRIKSISAVAERAIPSPSDPTRADLLAAIDRLSVVLQVAESMPLVKRKRAQARISEQLDEMEAAFVDAVLAKS